MLYTVTMNPALDKTATVGNFRVDKVNKISSFREDPGGKGINVSKVAAKLGEKSVAYAVLAGQTGEKIARMLQEGGIDVEAVMVKGETRTNLKVVDDVLGTNTDINEPGPVISSQDANRLAKAITATIGDGDVVVVSGSLPQGIRKEFYAELVVALRLTGAKVFLDADGEPLRVGIKARPSLIKPNDDELSRLVGRDLTSDAEIAEAARQLVSEGVEEVVVSMGGRGAIFATEDKTILAKAPKVKVGSTVGAGDSVVAALAVAEMKGLELEDAARLAVATGSANVMCSGTQAAEKSAVEALIPSVVIEELA